ncbi:mitochondrial carrier homolog 2-like [Sycon ciliatum]|uniref:mitochondrial carrier homolog 2-like n=1 Tax=Sycon ciliatum TaxID=27933 RepID=UPI0020ACE853
MVKDKAKKEESGPIQQVAFQTCLSTVAYPFHVVRTLVQVGHEPLPSTVGKTWFGFGSNAYFLPNCLTYSGHIRRTDGYAGLYRGLVPYVVNGGLQQISSRYLNDLIPTVKKDSNASTSEFTVDVVKDVARSAAIRTVVMVLGHPLHVINIRMVVYFVGRESAYSSFMGAVRSIYEDEGVGGFFSGIVPRVIGELLGMVAYEALFRTILKIAESGGHVDDHEELELYGRTLVNYLVRITTYPFQLTSTLMIVDGSRMAAASAVPVDCNGRWYKCLTALYSSGRNMRGNSLFNRIDKSRRVYTTRL